MFVELAARADTVRLSGLTADEVTALVTDVAGDAAADTWAAEVHRRTDGHPFFARQLTELLVGAGPAAAVPGAVRDVVDRRVRRLSAECRALVEAAAVAGNDLMPDVLAVVAGHDAATVTRLMEEGVQAGVLVRGADGTRLAHDLFRETVAAGLDVPRRLRLHQQIADALEQRRARGAAVAAADLARHTAAAAPLEGSDRAVGWARRAARADCARLAFAEAADHLARARRAVEDSGAPDAAGLLVDLLVEEADARARTGDPGQARTLLDDARGRASACGDAERLARVALGVQRLGARFAMPRDAVVEELEAALVGLSGRGTVAGGPPGREPRARAAPLGTRATAAGPAALGAGARPRPHPRRPHHARGVPARPPRHPLDAGPGGGADRDRPGDQRAGRAHRRRRTARRRAAAHRQRPARAGFRGLPLRAGRFPARLRRLPPAPPRLPRHDPPRRAGPARRAARRGRAADRHVERAGGAHRRARRGQRADVAAAGPGPGPARPRAAPRDRGRGGPVVGGRALARPRRRRRVPRAHRRPGRPRGRPPRPRHRGRLGRVAGRPLLPVVGVRRRDDHRGGAAGRPRACARSCWPSWSRSPTPAA